jgi:hypothetical protein
MLNTIVVIVNRMTGMAESEKSLIDTTIMIRNAVMISRAVLIAGFNFLFFILFTSFYIIIITLLFYFVNKKNPYSQGFSFVVMNRS